MTDAQMVFAPTFAIRTDYRKQLQLSPRREAALKLSGSFNAGCIQTAFGHLHCSLLVSRPVAALLCGCLYSKTLGGSHRLTGIRGRTGNIWRALTLPRLEKQLGFRKSITTPMRLPATTNACCCYGLSINYKNYFMCVVIQEYTQAVNCCSPTCNDNGHVTFKVSPGIDYFSLYW